MNHMSYTHELIDIASNSAPGVPRLTLERLTLRNFKGIRQFALDLTGGEHASVYGDNGTGKTTLFDAFNWLLFGKDSQNRSDFEIKTLDAENRVIHGLEHEVEGVFALHGEQITLRKVYQEKWTKQRGSAEATLTGHTTDHFIDGVPRKKAEYEGIVADIVDEKAFRLLSDPSHFNALHWEERRRILLDVCGDVSDADVVDSNSKLGELRAILGKRSLDDHRKVIKARRTEINKELEKLPVRISEAQRALPDMSGVNAKAVEQHITNAKADRQAKLEQIARAEMGGGVAEKQAELSRVRSQLLDMETAARRKNEDALREKRMALQEVRASIAGAERSIKELASAARQHEIEATQHASAVSHYRSDWHLTDEEELNYTEESACPTCGQALPTEALQAARDKAVADFNLWKAQELERISALGKAAKERQERAEAQAAKFREELREREADISRLSDQALGIEQELGMLASRQNDFSPEYVDLTKQRDTLLSQIAELKQGNQSATESLKSELATIEQAISALESTKAKLNHAEQGKARIAELQAQEKSLAAEYERLERELYLTEEFVRTKVRLLEERINSRFRLARFKLFDVQVNGGLSECCETLYNGVPYNSNLNRGARTNVGLDIVNTLCEHYGFAAPVWIDNAEAVTQLIPTHGQMIKLVVSEPDKTLRIVKEA